MRNFFLKKAASLKLNIFLFKKKIQEEGKYMSMEPLKKIVLFKNQKIRIENSNLLRSCEKSYKW